MNNISNKNKKYFYITSTLPYVNAEPHLGHVMEFVRADCIARWKRICNYDVFFNTGTDEHGQKLFESAKKENINVQDYVNKNAEHFKNLLKILNISNDAFIRTTDEKHKIAAKKIWKICKDNGYIYKKNYKIKYCVGCELEKQDSDLDENGKCPHHTNRDLEIREEENYFFAFSKFQDKLKEFYKESEINKNDFVIPNFRLQEIKDFTEKGLQDFSISRLKSKMPWGVSVPDDDEHIMYVWFDALTSYISTLGWGGEDEEMFNKYWVQEENLKNNIKREVVQICGKDNLRQQTAIWQAMLFAANIPNSTNIIVNGFITGENGIKMSKSLGNVVNPIDIQKEFGTDALRCFVLKEISSFDDSPFSLNIFIKAYNSNLVNGIGNQVNRILKLTSQYLNEIDINEILEENKKENLETKYIEYYENLNNFDINKAINFVFERSKKLDQYIQETEPFKLIKERLDLSEEENKINKIKAKEILKKCLSELLSIANHLYIFIPDTSEKIINLIKENKVPEKPLFERR